MTYSCTLWDPQLVFTGHNNEVELLEAKIRTSEIVAKFTAVPRWVLGTAGVPPVFLTGMNCLLGFLCNVETTKEALIEAKIERAQVNAATSLFEAEMKVIKGRLRRLMQDIPRRDRELEVVPAVAACEKTLALFADEKYAFWKKPEISSPLLVPFAGIYVTVAIMAIELIETYKEDMAEEMMRLAKTVYDYRKRFFCFRLYQVKYPIISFKDVVDNYDKKFRTSPKEKWSEEFYCFCFFKQEYTALLAKTYGSFFDSATVAIAESGILPSDVTVSQDWCTTHTRCCTLFRSEQNCICNLQCADLTIDFMKIKDKDAEKAIAAGNCLADISTSESLVRHFAYSCKTCETDDEECICLSCIRKCHNDHDVEFLRCDWFHCSCGDNSLTINCNLQTVETSLTNRDGAVVHKGNTGSGGDTEMDPSDLFYCGRFMEECRCGECDGRCGPTKGCPCEACLELVTPKALPEYNWPLVVCDECDEDPLIGPRYKCMKCEDYDLCHDCLESGTHNEHGFVRMTKYANGSRKTDVVHRYVGCDGCQALPVCGKRFKCVTCDNYDLCEECHDDQIHSHHEFKEVEAKRLGKSHIAWDKLVATMKRARFSKSDSVLEDYEDETSEDETSEDETSEDETSEDESDN